MLDAQEAKNPQIQKTRYLSQEYISLGESNDRNCVFTPMYIHKHVVHVHMYVYVHVYTEKELKTNEMRMIINCK